VPILFIVNVEAAINKGNKWLIIQRSKEEEHAGGLLSLVGGKVEEKSTQKDVLEIALKREVLEEVDLHVDKEMTYLHSVGFITDQGDQVINVVFLCKYKSGKAYPKSPEEVEQVLWMTTKEILEDSQAPDYLKESIKLADEKNR